MLLLNSPIPQKIQQILEFQTVSKSFLFPFPIYLLADYNSAGKSALWNCQFTNLVMFFLHMK